MHEKDPKFQDAEFNISKDPANVSQPKTINMSSSKAESFNDYLTSVLVKSGEMRVIEAKDLK